MNTQTDRSGTFRLLRIPTGQRNITISYLGYEDKTIPVNISSGSIASLDASLETSVKETVTVNSPLLEGQAKALNQQKENVNITNIVSADQIGRFPDPNAAERPITLSAF